MEVVTSTEMQDVYRVCDGVLLVVNKWEYEELNDKTTLISREDTSPYDRQIKYIRKLKKDVSTRDGRTILKGTPIIGQYPIKATDVSNYTYEVKTTGDSLSGDATELVELLEDIKNKISQY